MDREAAEKILCIKSPFNETELKRRFRRMAEITHPDKNSTSSEKFVQVKEAYDLLKNLCEILPPDETNGLDLSEFGHGLPFNKNGIPCKECEGKGYSFSVETIDVDVECPKCKGDGANWALCRVCNGTGEWKNKKTCRVCEGKGKFYYLAKQRLSRFTFNYYHFVRYIKGRYREVQRCSECSGKGNVAKPLVEKKYYYKCHMCKGCGEIEIYNPVLPKGFFSNLKV